MGHVLDRPIWTALTTSHQQLAEGDGLARRYPASIVPFAAAADGSAESIAALDRLPVGDETMVLVEANDIAVPAGLEVMSEAVLVQMLAARDFQRVADERIVPLGETDAAEMLALAQLTKPGPFTLKAQALGAFWGVRLDGRLVAMAGQRMRTDGFAELSGLCTHPDYQGRGLGRLLFGFVAGEIAARGETAFLHAYAANTKTVALYEALGFAVRAPMNMVAVRRRMGAQ